MIQLITKTTLALALLVTLSSCGRSIVAMGGIVDNGNKGATPPLETQTESKSGTPSDSASPANGPSMPGEKIYVFGDQHSLEVPADYMKVSIDEKTEAFSSADSEVLRLTLVTSACQNDSSTLTAKGLKLYNCGQDSEQNHLVVEAQNGDLIDVKSKLDEQSLDHIVDTIE